MKDLESEKTRLSGLLYSIATDKLESFQVNEFGLPIPEEQITLYYLKVAQAKKVLNGGTSATLSLEAELTNDTVENLATIIVGKQELYENQLGFIEVVRRVISEKLTVDEINEAEALIEKFKNANMFLDENSVREILR